MPNPEHRHPALFISEERLQRLQRWAEIASKSADEDAYLRHELNKQLDEMVVKVLDERLDSRLAEVEPATYGVDLYPWRAPMREDVVEPWPDSDALLACAPRTRGRYFVVPVSLHTEL